MTQPITTKAGTQKVDFLGTSQIYHRTSSLRRGSLAGQTAKVGSTIEDCLCFFKSRLNPRPHKGYHCPRISTKAGTQKVDFLGTSRFTIGRQLLHEPRDALGSAACGAAGRCPWSRVHSSATSVVARTCAESIGFSRRPNPKQVPKKSTRRPDLC